ncbi:hypothetical protein GCM10007860_27270 [Chitiniphilus shinanonensis]|uniref:Lipoprotein n=1 Tax=Chitiniphilus shinanonensis TaxID=553088 RepID=A0ABQ6BWL9_9NEIS|nr:hypothetical protein [Chitiniphilus shinanonensis]GLS05570.1 hypothetical protein GCM10007860_27270 [Chitiniphilus shinanonensis]
MIRIPLLLLSLALSCAAWAGHCADAQSTAPVAATAAKPYRLEAVLDRRDGLYTVAARTNLALSIAHYGGAHVPGEGHVHLYVNGRLIGPITSDQPLYLPPLVKGDNLVRLVLASNDHVESIYGVAAEAHVTPD